MVLKPQQVDSINKVAHQLHPPSIPVALAVGSGLGFLAGQITVPDDFDQMGAEIIETLFGNTP